VKEQEGKTIQKIWIGKDWKGLERIGKDWKGLERIGKDWKGLERIGKVDYLFVLILEAS
jgi:hypothetical protein